MERQFHRRISDDAQLLIRLSNDVHSRDHLLSTVFNSLGYNEFRRYKYVSQFDLHKRVTLPIVELYIESIRFGCHDVEGPYEYIRLFRLFRSEVIARCEYLKRHHALTWLGRMFSDGKRELYILSLDYIISELDHRHFDFGEPI